MGTRSERLKESQAEMERGSAPLTRATEGRVASAGIGVVTYLLVGMAALCLLWAAVGGGLAALASTAVWGLLAWANEALRARGRRRREG